MTVLATATGTTSGSWSRSCRSCSRSSTVWATRSIERDAGIRQCGDSCGADRALVPIAAEYQRAGRDAEADRLLDCILAAAPSHPQALHAKGLAVYKSGRLQNALALVERAFEHGLDASSYWRTICTVYERLNRLDEAVAAGRQAVAIDPTDAEAYHNLTIACYRHLDLDETMACARHAIELDPTLAGAHFALAEALLLRGEFAEGWQEYEWRFRIPGAAAPVADWPQWDGRPLGDGTLLLVADQGFGDVIQFARYIPWALQRCPKVAIACSRELRPLLAQLQPDLRLFSDWEKRPRFEAFCPLSGLPRLHGTTLATIPPVPRAYQRRSGAAAGQSRVP